MPALPHRLRLLVLLPLLLIAAACSMVSVAYNHADTALRWSADDYFDLDDAQWATFDRGLARLHAWHRREELPKLAALCDDAAARVERGLAPADFDWAEAALRARYAAIVEFSAADLAAVLATLRPEQLPAIDAKLVRVNAKFRTENLAGNPEERERKRVGDDLKRIEDWVGELDERQRERLATLLRALPQAGELRLLHRQQRQRELRGLLAARLPPELLAAALRPWLLDWEDGRSVEHQRVAAQWRRQGRQLLLELDALLLPPQRAHLAGKLRRYADEFRGLSRRQA